MFTSFSFKGLILAPIFFILFATTGIAKDFRIVSLTPSITKQLIGLGEKDNIVGCTTYCPIAKDKDSKVKVLGSVVSVNVESVFNLNPDIVFASSLTNPKVINKLKSLGVRVEVFSYPKSIQQIFDDFLKIGEIVNKRDIAKKIVTKAKDKLEKIVEAYNKYEPKRVFFQIGANPLFSTPKDTYIADMLRKVNSINIVENLSGGQISREWVIRENPEIIFIMDMGSIAVEEIKNWKRFRTIDAVKNNKIFVINADRLASPALPDFIYLIDEMGKLIHERIN